MCVCLSNFQFCTTVPNTTWLCVSVNVHLFARSCVSHVSVLWCDCFCILLTCACILLPCACVCVCVSVSACLFFVVQVIRKGNNPGNEGGFNSEEKRDSGIPTESRRTLGDSGFFSSSECTNKKIRKKRLLSQGVTTAKF